MQHIGPRVLTSCAHWDIIWKPASWAVSWTVHVAANFNAIPAKSFHGVPLVPDRPFAAGNAMPRDLLEWLVDEKETVSERGCACHSTCDPNHPLPLA